MKKQDKILLEVYMRGFTNELNGVSKNYKYNHLLLKAYNLGRQDAIVGDDVKSVDYLTNEEILKRIQK